ncbi:MAG: sigma-70 family RNA polymerase sigma factor [Candidatus Omnitrophica bacterium]|nr:sigma-70 family RNA polymerase sigma factor [Candidatus Omnitrophota bacterium]
MKENFEDLISKLSPTLRGITHKLNGHFTFFDEDDLFQEALEHLWIYYNQNKLGDKTDSYVLQGCYFHLKNYIRKTMDKANLISLQKLNEDGDSTLESFLGYEDRRIEENAESVSISESTAMKQMTVRERTILKLSMDGSTVREIGKSLGISHVMVIKIRKNMRKRFGRAFDRTETGYQN